MPTVYKVLGQSFPSANTLTTAYTVPASTSTVVSTIVVANLGGTPTTFRIAVRPAAASIANQHYVAYDVSIAPEDSITLTMGMTLATTDVVSVESFNGQTSFNLFGSEIA